MTNWVEIPEKYRATEVTVNEWNNLRQAFTHLEEGSLVQSNTGDFGGGWSSATPATWRMTFTLTHRATIVYEMVAAATIYNGLAGSPTPEALVGIRPILNGVVLTTGWPVAHVINRINNNWPFTEVPCVGFLPDLPAGSYTLDFQFETLLAINFNKGGGTDHAVSFTGIRKTLWEIST